MASSKFEKRFVNNSGAPLLGAVIELLPQGNEYPEGKLRLTEHPTRKGWYYRNNTPMNEYAIYIDGVIYTSNIFHSEKLLYEIAKKFDNDLNYIGKILNTTDCGSETFAGTNNSVNVVIDDASEEDLYVLTPRGTVFNSQDLLVVNPTAQGFTVTRGNTGTPNLTFNWFRRKTGTF